MSEDIQYIVRDESISHASFMGTVTSRYNARKQKEGTIAKKTQSIIGRDWSQNGQRKTNPYGNYKSPYYNPEKRHDYYEAHKDHVTRPYGTGGTSSSKGRSGSGKKGSSAKKGSSKGSGRGSGSSNSQSITDAITKLREESAVNTAAQQEATKRKIADLQEELAQHIEALKAAGGSEAEETLNTAEIRGKIQSLQDQVKKAGIDLNTWVKTEKESLARRIAAIKPKKDGEADYDTKQKEYEQALKTKNKEIESRADAIYKRKKKS